MNPVDAAAAEISANATPADVDAARAFLDVAAREGHAAAVASPGAVHLVRVYRIRRCLGAIARRIVADHPRPHDVRLREARARLLARWRAGGMSDADVKRRLARVQARWEEEDAKWRRADAREARAAYRGMSARERVRVRLAFRARRPRRPVG